MPAPAPAPDIRGRFLWYELLTTDPSSAAQFYGKVLGWSESPFPGQTQTGTPYTILSAGQSPVAGAMELPPDPKAAGVPPHWVAYVGTPDVDATLERAKSLGGSVVMEPFDIADVGRIAYLRDPQGAVFAIYKPTMETSPEADPAVGQVSWHELTTTDYEAAFTFYQDLFGWNKTTAMDMGPLGIYQMYGRAGREYGGMFNKNDEMPMPPNWGIYVRVDDVNATVPKIKDAGGQILNGPMEVPGGDLIANCADPQGAVFSIHSKKPA
jgi:uncharacterized protein